MTTPKPSEQAVEMSLRWDDAIDHSGAKVLAAEVRRLRTENERILEGRNIAESAMSLLRAELAAVKERVAHWEASSKLHSDSATKWHGQVAALKLSLAESLLRAVAVEADKALLDWYIHSEPGGHACRELIRANYGAEHPMGGDCRYCHYSRMDPEKRKAEGFRLFNERGDALHALATPTPPAQENEMSEEAEDICGLCGELGADKIPHPVHWPGEQVPGSDLVHASCERDECLRAHRDFTSRVGQSGVDRFLRSL